MALDRKAAVQRWLDDFFNRGDPDAIDDLFAPSAVIHEGGLNRAPSMLRAVYTASRTGLPDMSLKVDEILAEDDRVVARWTLRGTHTGNYKGFEPSGNSISMIGMSIFHFQGDQVVECWGVEDAYALMRQIGLL